MLGTAPQAIRWAVESAGKFAPQVGRGDGVGERAIEAYVGSGDVSVGFTASPQSASNARPSGRFAVSDKMSRRRNASGICRRSTTTCGRILLPALRAERPPEPVPELTPAVVAEIRARASATIRNPEHAERWARLEIMLRRRQLAIARARAGGRPR